MTFDDIFDKIHGITVINEAAAAAEAVKTRPKSGASEAAEKPVPDGPKKNLYAITFDEFNMAAISSATSDSFDKYTFSIVSDADEGIIVFAYCDEASLARFEADKSIRIRQRVKVADIAQMGKFITTYFERASRQLADMIKREDYSDKIIAFSIFIEYRDNFNLTASNGFPFSKLKELYLGYLTQLRKLIYAENSSVKDYISKVESGTNSEESKISLAYANIYVSKLRELDDKELVKNSKSLFDVMNGAVKKFGIANKDLDDMTGLEEMDRITALMMKFTKTRPITEEDVDAAAAPIIEKINEMKDVNPEFYDSASKYMQTVVQTKVGVIRAAKENKIDLEELGKESETGAVIGPGTTTGEEQILYELNVRLPLGTYVSIKNFDKLKKKKDIDEHEVEKITTVFDRFVEMSEKLFMYQPQGPAAAAMAWSSQFRKGFGEIVQWTAKNTIGLLAGTILGQKGVSFGEGIGRAIKYWMIQDIGQINPAIKDFENFLFNRKYATFGGRKMMHAGNEREDKFGYFQTGVKKAKPGVVRYVPANEEMSMGGAPGVAMQVPGSITGAGAPLAPTETKTGSGDSFQPCGVKKKKKRRHIMPYMQPIILKGSYNDK